MNKLEFQKLLAEIRDEQAETLSMEGTAGISKVPEEDEDAQQEPLPRQTGQGQSG